MARMDKPGGREERPAPPWKEAWTTAGTEERDASPYLLANPRELRSRPLEQNSDAQPEKASPERSGQACSGRGVRRHPLRLGAHPPPLVAGVNATPSLQPPVSFLVSRRPLFPSSCVSRSNRASLLHLRRGPALRWSPRSCRLQSCRDTSPRTSGRRDYAPRRM